MRRPVLAVLSAAALALCAPLAAEARTSYCSPTGDYCTQVKKKDGRVYLRLATFSFRGWVRVCVRDPRDWRTCRVSRLRKRGGLYRSSILWNRRYPNAGRGSYRVRWYWQGNRLGPALTFRR